MNLGLSNERSKSRGLLLAVASQVWRSRRQSDESFVFWRALACAFRTHGSLENEAVALPILDIWRI